MKNSITDFLDVFEQNVSKIEKISNLVSDSKKQEIIFEMLSGVVMEVLVKNYFVDKPEGWKDSYQED